MAKKRSNFIQTIIIVGAILVAAQAALFFYYRSKDNSLTVKDAIQKKIATKKNISPERKERLKIQVALNDYMINHQGNFPKNLEELVPLYFDRVPSDPTTGSAYIYKVDGKRYSLTLPGESLANANADKNSTTTGGKQDENSVQLTKDQQTTIIAQIDQENSSDKYVYDPSGKRDPFKPFNLAPQVQAGATPLENYEVGQLKLTAVLGDGENATAMVENAAGRGFPVRKGTKIGLSGGEVVEIQKDKLLILETSTDFSGQTKTRTVEMRLRTKEQSELGKSTN